MGGGASKRRLQFIKGTRKKPEGGTTEEVRIFSGDWGEAFATPSQRVTPLLFTVPH